MDYPNGYSDLSLHLGHMPLVLFFHVLWAHQESIKKKIQSNLDYSKCQGPHESFGIIGSSNDRKREFSDIFGKARTFHRTSLFCQSLQLQLVFSVK